MKLRKTTTAPQIDKVVTFALIGHVGAILATDVLFIKYRKNKRNGEPRITKGRPSEDCPVSYSSNVRNVRLLQAWFCFLAFHLTFNWKWDPLNMIARWIGER
jgi:hypothetical protein